jgi:hypothetical protein
MAVSAGRPRKTIEDYLATPGTVVTSSSLPGLRAPIDDLFRIPW